jgi:hypothetical protein
MRVKQDEWKARRYVPASKVPAEAFDLNMRLLLAMQQIGGGGSEAIVLGAMLDLCPSALANQFTTMEEDFCLMQQRVGMEQLEDNLKLERSFLVVDEDGEIGLDVSGDTRWDKRGTGSNYNSDSGYHLITGNKTKRVLTACPISCRCGKCELKKDHPNELCPKNYDGSSKGMEAHGSSINVNWIYNTEKKCYTRKYGGDDDYSTKSVLRWLYREALEVYQVPWPRTFFTSPSNSLQMPITESRHTPVRYLL